METVNPWLSMVAGAGIIAFAFGYWRFRCWLETDPFKGGVERFLSRPWRSEYGRAWDLIITSLVGLLGVIGVIRGVIALFI